MTRENLSLLLQILTLAAILFLIYSLRTTTYELKTSDRPSRFPTTIEPR